MKLLTLLKGKLHRATVTEANLEYEGSIGIDADLMKLADILPNEQVDIYNVTNGERFTTYAIKQAGGSGDICVQGAAAHKVSVGDKIIICAYIQMSQQEALEHKPSCILLNNNNVIA